MAEPAAERSGSGGLKSVDRALQLLHLLAQWGEGGVSDLAAELDVHKSTAFRLLGSLEAYGLVEQAEDRGKYQLGFGLVRLAGAASSRMDLTRNVRPVVEQRKGSTRDATMARDWALKSAYAAGATLQQLADATGLTRQRIQQIVSEVPR